MGWLLVTWPGRQLLRREGVSSWNGTFSSHLGAEGADAERQSSTYEEPDLCSKVGSRDHRHPGDSATTTPVTAGAWTNTWKGNRPANHETRFKSRAGRSRRGQIPLFNYFLTCQLHSDIHQRLRSTHLNPKSPPRPPGVLHGAVTAASGREGLAASSHRPECRARELWLLRSFVFMLLLSQRTRRFH